VLIFGASLRLPPPFGDALGRSKRDALPRGDGFLRLVAGGFGVDAGRGRDMYPRGLSASALEPRHAAKAFG